MERPIPRLMKSFEFTFQELQIETQDMEQMLGYDSGSSPAPIMETINDVIIDAPAHCSIKGGFLVLDDVVLNKAKHSVTVRDKEFHIQKNIFHHLRKLSHIAFFVCTAGKEISNWSKTLMNENKILKGYVVDVLGTIAVESAMIKIHIRLKKEMDANGLNITNRYSPGYCDWNVVDQPKLFSFFPHEFCGITLDRNSMMVPVKSICGIIGIGKNVVYDPYSCGLCQRNNCMYRTHKV